MSLSNMYSGKLDLASPRALLQGPLVFLLGIALPACGEPIQQDEGGPVDMSTSPREVVGDDTPRTTGEDASMLPPEQGDMGEEGGRVEDSGGAGVDQQEDSDDSSEPAVEPLRCGQEARCIDAFPTTLSGSTGGSLGSRHDRYACAPDIDESGPEILYEVLLDEPGFLAARLEDLPAGVDVDVHLLLDGQDANSCLDRGHFAAGAYLEAGAYWIVVDSWVDDQGRSLEGDFSLAVNHITASDLARHGLSPQLAEDAFDAFVKAWALEHSKRLEYTVTDFSLHSSEPRAWVFDLATDALLFHATIGHGIGSIEAQDRGVSSTFSNEPGSNTSSLGLMKAAEPYVGDYGYSMRLDGLEPGFNDNVRRRDIVVHPDERNRPEVTRQQGYLTPSRGCPTLEPDLSRRLIDTVKQGSLMFYWYPDEFWRSGSIFLN